MRTTTVEITLSEDLLSLGLDKEKIQKEIEKWLVLSLFREGKISSGKAGNLLGLGRRGFLDLLDREGIAYLDYSVEELEEEFRAVREQRRSIMTTSTPLDALRSLEQLYESGFHDTVTDAALRKIVESQTTRDRVALHDLENDLRELEQRYQLTSEEFFHRWQAGEMPDTADFMDWNALYQMALEVRGRLKLLQNKTETA
jgi:predicted HTH domain antitoxin